MDIGPPARMIEVAPASIPVPEILPLPRPHDLGGDPAPSTFERTSAAAAALVPGPAAPTEPVLAWRTWGIEGSRTGGEPMLLPIAGDGRPWPTRRAAEGTCTRRRSHRAPVVGCSCGLHAVRDPADLRHARCAAVVGTVALWGRVVEHERGFRAAFAYPQRLRLVCHLCLFLGGAHRCEVVVRHRGGRMVPLCRTHLDLSIRYGYPVPRTLDAHVVEAELLGAYAVDRSPVPPQRVPSDAGAVLIWVS